MVYLWNAAYYRSYCCRGFIQQRYRGRTPTGSFDAVGFNEGWTLEMNGKTEAITLPAYVNAKNGDFLIIKNTLPADIPNGSSLMMRASMEDMYIYVNGELREQYATESISVNAYYLPSAYVVTELSEQDSCAEIAVHIRVKSRGALNEVLIGQGNNVWFKVIQNNISVNAVAFVVLILGVILIIAWLVLHRFEQSSRASFFLGLLMTDINIWVFSTKNTTNLM